MDSQVGVPYVPIKSPIPPPSTEQKPRNLDAAFPPMYAGVPYKSVYERAGFDVNKGGKNYASSIRSRRRKGSTTSNSTTTTASSKYLVPSTTNTSVKTSPTPTIDSASSSFGAQRKVSLPHISVVTNNEFKELHEAANRAIPEEYPPNQYYQPPHSNPTPPPQLCRFPTPPHTSANCHFPESLHPPESPRHRDNFDLPDTPSSPYTFNDNDFYSATPPLEDYQLPRPLSNSSSIYTNAVDPVCEPSPYPAAIPPQSPPPPMPTSHNGIPQTIPEDPLSTAPVAEVPIRAPERNSNHNMPNYRRKNSHASQPSTSSSSRSSSNQDSLYSPKGLSTPISPVDSDGAKFHPDFSTATVPLFQQTDNKPKRKKQCRGCGLKIVGKCVSSKDGRLSGKWHRECFKCSSCNGAFDSTEFYVHNDLPYCGPCYHTENNSVCQACSIGIEGECLETSNYNDNTTVVRYHLECLTCSHCFVSLTDTYYCSSDGRTLCSTHAYDSNSKLEKRRTRILVV